MYIKSYAVTYTNDLLYKGRKHLIFYRELNEKLYLFLSNIYLSTQKKIHPPIRLAIIVFHIALNDIYFKHKYKIGLDNCHLIKYKKNFFIYLTPLFFTSIKSSFKPTVREPGTRFTVEVYPPRPSSRTEGLKPPITL